MSGKETHAEHEHERHEDFDEVHAHFIGPKGANLPDFRANINTILDELLVARQSYQPEDQVIINQHPLICWKLIQAGLHLQEIPSFTSFPESQI